VSSRTTPLFWVARVAMNEPILLMFAYHFPPENVIGAARPFRFYKYLARMQQCCQVFTAAGPPPLQDSAVEYVPDPFLTTTRLDLRRTVELALRKVLLPGAIGTRWAYDASESARSFMRHHPGSRKVAFSTFPPLGAHVAAWRLARKEGIPWIADFRDPLADNPADSSKSSLQRLIDQRLERTLLESAHLIIANTDSAAERMIGLYPKRRDDIHVIWNGFDPEDRLVAQPLPQHEFSVLSHVGELYWSRTVTPLLESIGRLVDTGWLAASKIRVQLVGPAHESSVPDRGFLTRARAQGWLDIVAEQVSLSEARRITETSDGLILVQPHTILQVPGKLFEYLQVGRPILAFVARNSPIERILQKSGILYRCVYPDNSPESMDSTVMEFFRLPQDSVRPSSWFEQTFNAEKQTEMLYQLIQSVINRPAAIR
jgi:glycosyltransferase involved in cell wall biosynthesis